MWMVLSISERELTPDLFAQKYLSTYYSLDYRVENRKLINHTKTAWYYLVNVSAFVKTKKRRELIGFMIVKDPNKSNRFEVILEIFEKGFNVRFPKNKKHGKGEK